jgi:hypothetical protein
MPFPLLGLIAGALAGFGKHLGDAQKFQKEKEVQGATTRYSPWTHMQAAAPTRPGSIFGDVLSGGTAGASFQQGLDSSDTYNDFLKSKMARDTAGVADVGGGPNLWGAIMPGGPQNNYGANLGNVYSTLKPPTINPWGQ